MEVYRDAYEMELTDDEIRNDWVKEHNRNVATINSVYNNLISQVQVIFDNILKEKFNDTSLVYATILSDERFRVNVYRKDANYPYDIDLNYYGRYGDERVISMNTSCFGSFYVKDDDKRNYHIVCGYVAENLHRFEEELAKLDWNLLDMCRQTYSRTLNKIETYDKERIAKERKEKEDAIRPLLVKGALINKRPKHEKDEYWKYGVETIESVTKKNVIFEGWGKKRQPIDEVMRKLVDGEWAFTNMDEINAWEDEQKRIREEARNAPSGEETDSTEA